MKKLCLTLLPALLLAYGPGDTPARETLIELGVDGDGVYVIDFFASWCRSCRRETPLLASLDRKRIGGREVRVVGVDVDRNVEEGRRFTKRLRDRYGVRFEVVEDPDGKIIGRFDPPGIPALYLVYRGRIVESYIGAKEGIGTILERRIEELP